MLSTSFDSGVPLTDVQTDMGHRDPPTTRRYDRARQRLDRSGAYRVAAAIDGGDAARRRAAPLTA